MYLISYQKRNGEVFCRIRNTIPECGLGHETSMGWLVIDIKYYFKNGFYSLRDYQIKRDYYFKRKHLSRNIRQFFIHYGTTILLFIILIILIK